MRRHSSGAACPTTGAVVSFLQPSRVRTRSHSRHITTIVSPRARLPPCVIQCVQESKRENVHLASNYHPLKYLSHCR